MPPIYIPTKNTRLVFQALIDLAGKHGHATAPQIGRKCRLSMDTVYPALAELNKKRYIEPGSMGWQLGDKVTVNVWGKATFDDGRVRNRS